LKPIWNQKPIVKSRHQELLVFWKTYLKPTFIVWNMKINTHYGKHISYLVIEMKTFNVLEFYNGFCCYFKSTCSNFDKVIKLFTLSCLHPCNVYASMVFVWLARNLITPRCLHEHAKASNDHCLCASHLSSIFDAFPANSIVLGMWLNFLIRTLCTTP